MNGASHKKQNTFILAHQTRTVFVSTSPDDAVSHSLHQSRHVQEMLYLSCLSLLQTASSHVKEGECERETEEVEEEERRVRVLCKKCRHAECTAGLNEIT